MEYTSKNVGNAALTTGIIGTSLGAIASMGGLANILGIGNKASSDPGDRPVTRYEMSLMQDINAKNDEIVLLKATKYTDDKAAEQAVFNATTVGTVSAIQQQVAMLQSLTRVYVPNDHVAPGWGPAFVSPFPPAPVAPITNTPNQGTTTTSSNG